MVLQTVCLLPRRTYVVSQTAKSPSYHINLVLSCFLSLPYGLALRNGSLRAERISTNRLPFFLIILNITTVHPTIIFLTQNPKFPITSKLLFYLHLTRPSEHACASHCSPGPASSPVLHYVVVLGLH